MDVMRLNSGKNFGLNVIVSPDSTLFKLFYTPIKPDFNENILRLTSESSEARQFTLVLTKTEAF